MNPLYLNLGCIVLSSAILSFPNQNATVRYVNFGAVLVNVFAVIIRTGV